jgi:hypothetical protein
MKRRTGLVSNSSSSSFLLFLEKVPESKLEVKNTFFPNDEVFGNPYHYGNEPRGWPIGHIVDILFQDLKDQEPLTEDEIVEEISSGWHGETDPLWEVWDKCEEEYGKFPYRGTDEEKREYHQKRNKIWAQWRKEKEDKVREFMKTLPKSNVVLHASYSDNDGTLNSALEHGDTFSNVDYLCISHH